MPGSSARPTLGPRSSYVRALFPLFALALLGLVSACGVDARDGDRDDRDDKGPGSEAPAVCGDGACHADERCGSCESDCGVCAWPPAWSALEEEVVVLVNQARANGATCPSGPRPATHPLTWNDELAEAARLHSLDMAEQDYFSHTSLDGRSPWDRMEDAGYTGFPTSENIAAGSRTAQDAFNSWMSSDGHCRNIMSSNPNEIGVGYATVEGSSWGHYWTQTFGER